MQVWQRDEAGARVGRLGGLLLGGAAALVGVAIVADGALARVVNGVGAIGWLTALVLLARSVRGTERWPAAASATVVAVVALAVLVRPRDLAVASVAFLLAGAMIAIAARDWRHLWALLVPAAWLPAHLLVNIARSALAGSTRVRTDPPPTAALVPLAMVLAAGIGGLLVTRLLEHRSGRGSRPTIRASAG